MRRRITLDPDVQLLIERAMRERGRTFNEAVNEAIRAGLGSAAAASEGSYTTPRDLGTPSVDLTKALRLASQLEDDVRVARLLEGR